MDQPIPETPVEAAPNHANSPDWSTTQIEVSCPLCGYNLRGLVEPRCPECGYQFAWRELLDAKLRQHAFVFEHHQEKNVRSFFRTIVATWRPRKFWTMLKPSQASRPGRLFKYWIIVNFVPLLAWQMWFFLNFQSMRGLGLYSARTSTAGTYFGTPISNWGGSFSFDVAHFHFGLTGRPSTNELELFSSRMNLGDLPYLFFRVCGLCVLLPMLSWLGLMIFQGTMRQKRIRPSHMARCVIYSWDTQFWVGPLLLIALAIAIAVRGTRGVANVFDGEPFLDMPYIALVLIALPVAYSVIATWRLCEAFKRYLQFPDPVSTIFIVQAMVWLACLTAFVLVSDYIR